MYLRNILSSDPFREMDRFQQEMNQLFDGFTGTRSRSYPATNIWTNQDAIAITAELPGYDPKEVDISILNGILSIKGKRKQIEIDEDEQYHRQERVYGDFERSIQLPFAVDNESVRALFKNGILQILLPRAEEDKPKRIEIKTN